MLDDDNISETSILDNLDINNYDENHIDSSKQEGGAGGVSINSNPQIGQTQFQERIEAMALNQQEEKERQQKEVEAAKKKEEAAAMKAKKKEEAAAKRMADAAEKAKKKEVDAAEKKDEEARKQARKAAAEKQDAAMAVQKALAAKEAAEKKDKEARKAANEAAENKKAAEATDVKAVVAKAKIKAEAEAEAEVKAVVAAAATAAAAEAKTNTKAEAEAEAKVKAVVAAAATATATAAAAEEAEAEAKQVREEEKQAREENMRRRAQNEAMVQRQAEEAVQRQAEEAVQRHAEVVHNEIKAKQNKYWYDLNKKIKHESNSKEQNTQNKFDDKFDEVFEKFKHSIHDFQEIDTKFSITTNIKNILNYKMFESEKSRIDSNYAEIINLTYHPKFSNIINIEKTSGKLPFIIKDYFFDKDKYHHYITIEKIKDLDIPAFEKFNEIIKNDVEMFKIVSFPQENYFYNLKLKDYKKYLSEEFFKDNPLILEKVIKTDIKNKFFQDKTKTSYLYQNYAKFINVTQEARDPNIIKIEKTSGKLPFKIIGYWSIENKNYIAIRVDKNLVLSDSKNKLEALKKFENIIKNDVEVFKIEPDESELINLKELKDYNNYLTNNYTEEKPLKLEKAKNGKIIKVEIDSNGNLKINKGEGRFPFEFKKLDEDEVNNIKIKITSESETFNDTSNNSIKLRKNEKFIVKTLQPNTNKPITESDIMKHFFQEHLDQPIILERSFIMDKGGSINLDEEELNNEEELDDDQELDNEQELDDEEELDNEQELDDINSDNNKDFDNEDFDNEDLSDINSDNNEENYSGEESDDSLKIFGGTGNTNFGIDRFSPEKKKSISYGEVAVKASAPLTYPVIGVYKTGKKLFKPTSSNIVDTIKDKLYTAKTGKCFELGKKFNNTGDSKLEIEDAKTFIDFMFIATFEFYKKLKDSNTEISSVPAEAGEAPAPAPAEAGAGVKIYEIDKFFRAYLNRLYKFAKLNIYVIVNCSSILQELSKAIHILITKKLDDALNDADDVHDKKDRHQKNERNKRKNTGEETLADLMDNKDIFGISSYFNMHSLAMMNFIFDAYNTAIPRIEDIIKSTHNTDERLDQISKYLTLKYDMTILGKDTSNEVNERYVEENNYINNLLKDLFPKMGFMDKSIMKNLKKIDKIIENNSENTLLLQNELQDLINITFENGNILFENEKVSEMKKQDNSDMLQQEIDNLQNEIQKLKELQGLQGE